ncbi:MAG: hypothetical protein HY271_08770 [Deltaproteobacteria bacterium]|nr:hypothetical protein [Deltaproteobacteria bacterium]
MATNDLSGRGTDDNPPNRFEQLHVELDEDERALAAEDAASAPRTVFYRDTSRSILAENDSPDIGFRFSLNPYRGCEHGCVYCLGPETPILHADMTWRWLGEVQVGDVLVGFDEFSQPGRTRKLRHSIVEAVWWSRRPTLRLITERTDVVTTAEHRWLQARNFRWSRTRQLSPGRHLRYIPVIADEGIDDDYRVGYVAGLSLGDGTFRYEPGWRSNRLGYPAAYWRIALVDEEPLARVVDHLGRFGVDAHTRPFSSGSTVTRKPMLKVEIRSLRLLAIIHALIKIERDTRNYRRGFLAGFFDAEGSNGDSLRISQVDVSVLE